MFQDIKARMIEPEVGIIISYAAFDGSPEGVEKIVLQYQSSESLNFYGWVEDGRIVSICGYEVHSGNVEVRSNKVEVHLISVAEDRQRQGVGKAMVDALLRMYGLPIEAETDDGAVEFYRKCGFKTTEFYHHIKGKRYTCFLEAERQGVGKAMVAALLKMHGLPIEAETDDGAVEFYRKCGFKTTEFHHHIKGKRYTCFLEAAAGYSAEELSEAHRSLYSTLKKCEKVLENDKLPQSQRTLTARRVAALKLALKLIEREQAR